MEEVGQRREQLPRRKASAPAHAPYLRPCRQNAGNIGNISKYCALKIADRQSEEVPLGCNEVVDCLRWLNAGHGLIQRFLRLKTQFVELILAPGLAAGMFLTTKYTNVTKSVQIHR